MATDTLYLCVQSGTPARLFALVGAQLVAIGLPGGTWVQSWPGQPPSPLVQLAVWSVPEQRLFGLDENGTLWAITLPIGGTWSSDWPAATTSDGNTVRFTRITVQNATGPGHNDAHLIGLDEDGGIWALYLPNGTWIQSWPAPPQVPLREIAAQGGPDPHLFGLDGNGKLWSIRLADGATWTTDWCEQEGMQFTAFAVTDGPGPGVMAIDVNHDLWSCPLSIGQWGKNWPQRPPETLSQITVQGGPNGVIFGTGSDQTLWACPISGGGTWTRNWPRAFPRFEPLTEQEVRAAIAKYGPVVRLHPDDEYRPCSVEWFLQHATLHDGNPSDDITHPTVDQLPIGPKDGNRYWLTLDDGAKGGSLATAKAYVNAHWTPDLSYTDLQFWFFYAYNGSAYGEVDLFGAHVTASADLAPLGEHYGDWECCMLRIENATLDLIGVWTSAHGDGQYFDTAELSRFQRVNGDQIVVYSSRHGHAMFAGADTNPTETRKWPGGEFFLHNDTEDGGPSIDCGETANYVIVAGDGLAASVSQPRWLDYPYRWGPRDDKIILDADTIARIISRALGRWAMFLKLNTVFHIASYLVTYFADQDRNGPDGPKHQPPWDGIY